MRISKILLSLVLMASAATAVTANASSCNMRDGKGRFAASNPVKKSLGAKKVSKADPAPTKTRKGRK